MIRLPHTIAWLGERFRPLPHEFGPLVDFVHVDLPLAGRVAGKFAGSVAHERASRMREIDERELYLTAHGVLNCILAELLGISPNRVVLAFEKLGKPRLPSSDVTFNVSRSGSALLIGLSTCGEIGVDIEQMHEPPNLDGLAVSQLSRREYAAWRCRPKAFRAAEFLQLWTRKEACVKAAGIGLVMPLASVEVGIAASEATEARFGHGRKQWRASVASLSAPGNSVAAAALISGDASTSTQPA